FFGEPVGHGSQARHNGGLLVLAPGAGGGLVVVAEEGVEHGETPRFRQGRMTALRSDILMAKIARDSAAERAPRHVTGGGLSRFGFVHAQRRAAYRRPRSANSAGVLAAGALADAVAPALPAAAPRPPFTPAPPG